MKTISEIEEKYKDRLLISIFDRLNKINGAEWKEIAREDNVLAEAINSIMSDISNLKRGNVASHLRYKNPRSYKNYKKEDLFNRKVSASIKRIKNQIAALNKEG